MLTLKPLQGIVPIVQAGDPVLRQPALPLSADEIRSPEIQNLIEVMRQTMHAAPGVGLAAPQIGVNLQLAVIEDKPEYIKDVSSEFLRERDRHPVGFHTIINPVLTAAVGETGEFFEGCLSVQGFTAVVQRPLRVRVECVNEKAEPQSIDASGWYARILQHEIDHLHGTLYIDRMKVRTFSALPMFDAHYKGRSMAYIRTMVGWE